MLLMSWLDAKMPVSVNAIPWISLNCFQLIRECKDVLTAATIVKQYYQYMVDPVIWDEKEAEEKFTTDLDQFDSDLRSMLEVTTHFQITFKLLPPMSYHLVKRIYNKTFIFLLAQSWFYILPTTMNGIWGANFFCVQVYFSFLQSWIYRLQSLPEGSQDLKSALEDEWDFTRNICIYIVGGEAEAGKRFR